ncbi:uncharacterized protein LOC126315345 [Schistocerca gregaria]|uniref:uncharacterized protein LOC126315345 n=1 Tax=Schistocerca gregaria TaxID=7010 RepID=UPI00211EF268|nr:uncharacterized protein LOC126315345 [Schistocerca gregaria]
MKRRLTQAFTNRSVSNPVNFEVNSNIAAYNLSIDVKKEQIREISKQFKKYSKLVQGEIDCLRFISEQLDEFSRLLKTQPESFQEVACMLEMSDCNKYLAEIKDRLNNKMNHLFCNRYSSFLNNEVTPVVENKKNFDKETMEYDSAYTKHKNAQKNMKLSLREKEREEEQFLAYRESYAKSEAEILEQLRQTNAKAENLAMLTVVGYWYMLKSYFKEGSDVVNKMESKIRRHKQHLKLQNKASKMFSRPLKEVCESEGRRVPAIVVACCEYLRANGVKTQGIFRVSPTKDDLDELRMSVDQRYVKFEDESPHLVAGLLKLYLRELPSPLFEHHDLGGFLKIVEVEDKKEQVALLKKYLSELPLSNYKSMQHIIRLCVEIAENSDVNKMTAQNLSVILAPNFFKVTENPAELLIKQMESINYLFYCLIANYASIFEVDDLNLDKIDREMDMDVLEQSDEDVLSGEQQFYTSSESKIFSPTEASEAGAPQSLRLGQYETAGGGARQSSEGEEVQESRRYPWLLLGRGGRYKKSSVSKLSYHSSRVPATIHGIHRNQRDQGGSDRGSVLVGLASAFQKSDSGGSRLSMSVDNAREASGAEGSLSQGEQPEAHFRRGLVAGRGTDEERRGGALSGSKVMLSSSPGTYSLNNEILEGGKELKSEEVDRGRRGALSGWRQQLGEGETDGSPAQAHEGSVRFSERRDDEKTEKDERRGSLDMYFGPLGEVPFEEPLEEVREQVEKRVGDFTSMNDEGLKYFLGLDYPIITSRVFSSRPYHSLVGSLFSFIEAMSVAAKFESESPAELVRLYKRASDDLREKAQRFFDFLSHASSTELSSAERELCDATEILLNGVRFIAMKSGACTTKSYQNYVQEFILGFSTNLAFCLESVMVREFDFYKERVSLLLKKIVDMYSSFLNDMIGNASSSGDELEISNVDVFYMLRFSVLRTNLSKNTTLFRQCLQDTGKIQALLKELVGGDGGAVPQLRRVECIKDLTQLIRKDLLIDEKSSNVDPYIALWEEIVSFTELLDSDWVAEVKRDGRPVKVSFVCALFSVLLVECRKWMPVGEEWCLSSLEALESVDRFLSATEVLRQHIAELVMGKGDGFDDLEILTNCLFCTLYANCQSLMLKTAEFVLSKANDGDELMGIITLLFKILNIMEFVFSKTSRLFVS